MTISQQDIDALDAAIMSAELTVKINGREITYRSIDELKRVRRFAVRQQFRKQGHKTHPLKGITTVGSRGL